MNSTLRWIHYCTAPEFGHITLHGPLDQPTLKRLVHLVYDVRRDDAPLHQSRRDTG